MITALLFALCIVSSGLEGNVYKRLTADSRSRAGSALMAGSWCLGLALLFGAAAVLTRSTGISAVRALLAAGGGLCLFLASFLLLAGRINAAALFTVLTSASIILSVTVGLLFQKERFTWKVAVSLVFCAVAILCQTGAIIAAGG